MKRNIQLLFFEVCGYLYQVYFLLLCTIWRKIVVIPVYFLRPPLTDEHWKWYLEHPPAVPNEDQVVAVYLILVWVAWAVVLLGLYQILDNRDRRERLGKRRISVVCGIGGACCMAGFLYGKFFGQPFYLFLGAIPVECLYITMLVLLALLRRSLKEQKQ